MLCINIVLCTLATRCLSYYAMYKHIVASYVYDYSGYYVIMLMYKHIVASYVYDYSGYYVIMLMYKHIVASYVYDYSGYYVIMLMYKYIVASYVYDYSGFFTVEVQDQCFTFICSYCYLSTTVYTAKLHITFSYIN